MKQVILNTLLAAGAFAPFRMANRSKALILMYHRFSEDEAETEAKTTARAFAQQLDYLAAHYRVVPLSVIAECVSRGAELPRGAAAITIDDGYADAYRIAFPLLRQRRLPATLYVTTDFVDRRCWLWTDKMRYVVARAQAKVFEVAVGERILKLKLDGEESRRAAVECINAALKALPDGEKDESIARVAASLGARVPAAPPPEFEAVTWDEAREMDAAGVEIASHTVTHPILTNVDDARLRRELVESKARLESELGRPVENLCYPNGDTNERVRCATADAGYKWAVAVAPGLINARRADALALPRIPAEHDFAHFVQSTSGFDALKNRLRPGAESAAGLVCD